VTMIDVATSTVPAGTGALQNPIPLTGVPYGLAVSPDGSSLWVSRDNGLKASVIDTSTNKVTTTFNLTGKPEGVTFSPDGRRVYMPMQTGGIAVFDATNDTQLAYLASLSRPTERSPTRPTMTTTPSPSMTSTTPCQPSPAPRRAELLARCTRRSLPP
jgi:YVTN family beta-propeller protein